MSAELREPRLERMPGPRNGVAVLDLAGELDLSVSGRFRELVDGVLGDGTELVVVDLTEVGFMDSTMLRELLRANKEVAASGGRLVVAGPQSSVRRLLDLTGTTDVFAVAASRDEALASEG
jgi:anti-anti-sigma factor